jgi:hypothetical protein
MTQPILIVEVDSSGATVTIDPDASLVPQIVWLKPQGGAPITLSGNWSIAFSSDPAQGNQTTFIWFANDFNLDNNTFTFQIQSQTITQDMLDANGAFTAITVDEAGLQQYIYTPDFNTAEALNGTAIKEGTIPLNRLVSVADSKFVVGDSTNVAAEATMSGDVSAVYDAMSGNIVTTIQPDTITNAMLKDLASGYFKLGDGSNRPADVQMTGPVTMNNAGVTSIGAGVITPENLSFTTGVLSVAQLTLSSADILALNTTPLEIIPAPGVGSSIVVISAVLNYTYVTSAYTANALQVYTDTATAPQAAAACLDSTTSRQVRLSLSTGSIGASDTMVIENKALLVNVATADPSGGLGTAVLTVYYVVL